MTLSLKEKEDFVVEMLNKNYTLRDVASKAHVSFSFISATRKKIAGEEIVNDKQKNKPSKPLSIVSQAFQLFKEGNSLIDVAITLDQLKENVIQYYLDYLTLQNIGRVATILKEHRNNIVSFVKLFIFY
jgi:hypothetical protein